MSIRQTLGRVLRRADAALAGRLGRPRRGTLYAFAFHGIGPAGPDAPVDPRWTVPLGALERFFAFWHGHGARFVSLADVEAGLDPAGVSVLATFDDGYATQRAALPLAERYAAPLTLFVCPGLIDRGEAMWWDVLYREGRARGWPLSRIDERRRAWQQEPPERIRAHLASAFGEAALAERGDEDRLLRSGELEALGRHPLVTLANHTHEHVALAARPGAVVEAQVRRAADVLAEWERSAPSALAYPEGAIDAAAMEAVRTAGVGLAFTTRGAGAALPLVARLAIPRTSLRAGMPIEQQCRRACGWRLTGRPR